MPCEKLQILMHVCMQACPLSSDVPDYGDTPTPGFLKVTVTPLSSFYFKVDLEETSVVQEFPIFLFQTSEINAERDYMSNTHKPRHSILFLVKVYSACWELKKNPFYDLSHMH